MNFKWLYDVTTVAQSEVMGFLQWESWTKTLRSAPLRDISIRTFYKITFPGNSIAIFLCLTFFWIKLTWSTPGVWGRSSQIWIFLFCSYLEDINCFLTWLLDSFFMEDSQLMNELFPAPPSGVFLKVPVFK